VTEDQAAGPVLRVVFYRTEAGNEPVRLWLKSLDRADRKTLGEDVKTAQYGWPLGMPLIRKLEPGLWEVRSRITGGIARVIFTVSGGHDGVAAWLRQEDAKDAAGRAADCPETAGIPQRGGEQMKKERLGSDFDDFLREEHLLEASEATAAKRVIAFQIEQEMRRHRLTKSEMASRMKTSRPALERLLDPANPSVTLSTLERAAAALGKKLKVELA
jgi:hypothetical protein